MTVNIEGSPTGKIYEQLNSDAGNIEQGLAQRLCTLILGQFFRNDGHRTGDVHGRGVVFVADDVPAE